MDTAKSMEERTLPESRAREYLKSDTIALGMEFVEDTIRWRVTNISKRGNGYWVTFRLQGRYDKRTPTKVIGVSNCWWTLPLQY